MCGTVGALILILVLTLLVIITVRCVFKHCSEGVSKSDDSGKWIDTKSVLIVQCNYLPQTVSETHKEPIEMKKNEVYGISIAALEPERPPQGSVLMSRNICYVTVQDFK